METGLAGAHERWLAEGLSTSQEGIQALINLDTQRAQAEQIADALMVRTPPGAEVYVRLVRALEGAWEARNALVRAAHLPPTHARYDFAAADEQMARGRATFARERYAFRVAAQKHVASSGVLSRVLNRAKPSKPKEPEDTESSTDSSDSG